MDLSTRYKASDREKLFMGYKGGLLTTGTQETLLDMIAGMPFVLNVSHVLCP